MRPGGRNVSNGHAGRQLNQEKETWGRRNYREVLTKKKNVPLNLVILADSFFFLIFQQLFWLIFYIWTFLKLNISSSFIPQNQNMPFSQIWSSTMMIKRWAWWVLYMLIGSGQWLAMKGLKRSAFVLYNLNPAFEI